MFSRERSRGTGPRATVCKAVTDTQEETLSGDVRPPRDGMQGRLRFTVGRGPVPRRAIGPACAPPLCRARAPALAVREQALPNYSLFKVCKTLMSIARAGCQVRKVL